MVVPRMGILRTLIINIHGMGILGRFCFYMPWVSLEGFAWVFFFFFLINYLFDCTGSQLQPVNSKLLLVTCGNLGPLH